MKKQKMNPELFNKYFDNTATDVELKQVTEWLEADPFHQRELERLDTVFAAAVIYGPDVQHNTKKTFKRIIPLRRLGRYITEAAAVVAVAFGLSYLMTENRLGKWTQRMTTLEVPTGHYISMKLEDGTTVWLNSGTRLEYPSVFADGVRRVKVAGEAMFDVEHDAKRPFIVETFACDVEVLGTKFDVIAEEAEGRFSTALLSGSVKVTNRLTPHEQFILKPNEEVELIGRNLNLNSITNPDEYLWIHGVISIKGLPFQELMRKFEKSFGVKILVERNQIPAIDYNYGKIRVSDGIDSALRLLQLTADFTYEKSEDNAIIIIK